MFLLFLACNSGEEKEMEFSFGDGGQRCYNSTECPKGAACIDYVCQRSGCITSADCKLGKYCTEAYKCKVGCELDLDCFPGQSCLDGQCVEYTCRDTDLDCQVGQYCGENGCESDGFPYCGSCTAEDFRRMGDQGGFCWVEEADYSNPCFWDPQAQSWSGCPTGLHCIPMSFISPEQNNGPSNPNSEAGVCAKTRALKYCERDSECPRGFTCYDNIVCWGDCDYYAQEGYLP